MFGSGHRMPLTENNKRYCVVHEFNETQSQCTGMIFRHVGFSATQGWTLSSLSLSKQHHGSSHGELAEHQYRSSNKDVNQNCARPCIKLTPDPEARMPKLSLHSALTTQTPAFIHCSTRRSIHKECALIVVWCKKTYALSCCFLLSCNVGRVTAENRFELLGISCNIGRLLVLVRLRGVSCMKLKSSPRD